MVRHGCTIACPAGHVAGCQIGAEDIGRVLDRAAAELSVVGPVLAAVAAELGSRRPVAVD